MVHVATSWGARLTGGRGSRARVIWIGILLAAGAVMILLDGPASLTDEDDYMPYALGDLARGDNPYATAHEATRTSTGPFGGDTYTWSTVYPYLPVLAILQIPFLDYRFTAMIAYGLFLYAMRERALPFYAFANPLVLWFAASGFNDFVVLALLAWGRRTTSPWLTGLACAAKQFALPLVLVVAALERDLRGAVRAIVIAGAIMLPFILWGPAAFLDGSVLQHLNKVGNVPWHYNYLFYPLWLGVAVVPTLRRGSQAPMATATEVQP